MVAVVGGERETWPTAVEENVPVHRRDASSDLELAAGVVDLDSRDRLRELERAEGNPFITGTAR